jgi:hypothetical protein
MKDIFDRFALMDFLGYLFPGVTALLGIYVFVSLLYLPDIVLPGNLDLAEGLVLFVVSYVFGVVLSSFSWPLLRAANWLYRKLGKETDAREQIHPTLLKGEVRAVFERLFGTTTPLLNEWTEHNFYISRSLVDQFMPRQASLAGRQNALRVLRQYMLPPIFIWLCVGIAWGLKLWGFSRLISVTAILGSMALGLVTTMLVVHRLNLNREREVREVYIALVIGHLTGVFERDRGDAQPLASTGQNRAAHGPAG